MIIGPESFRIPIAATESTRSFILSFLRGVGGSKARDRDTSRLEWLRARLRNAELDNVLRVSQMLRPSRRLALGEGGASSDGRETTEARAGARAGAGARDVRAHSSASIPTRPLTARSSGCARRGKVTWRRAGGPGDGLLSPPATSDHRLLLPRTRRCLDAPVLDWLVRDGLNSAAFLVDALVGSSRLAPVEAEGTGSREVCWRFLKV